MYLRRSPGRTTLRRWACGRQRKEEGTGGRERAFSFVVKDKGGETSTKRVLSGIGERKRSCTWVGVCAIYFVIILRVYKPR